MAWTIDTAVDFVVLRFDPEYADIGNPRGEIVGERFYLRAENEAGDRRRTGSFETEEEALAAVPTAPPISEWGEDYPVYGSPAYEDYGQAEAIADERRAAEDERWYPRY